MCRDSRHRRAVLHNRKRWGHARGLRGVTKPRAAAAYKAYLLIPHRLSPLKPATTHGQMRRVCVRAWQRQPRLGHAGLPGE